MTDGVDWEIFFQLFILSLLISGHHSFVIGAQMLKK